MKILNLVIKNIGMIADETIPFNKPLLLFYGDIRQGKSTILNAVRWVTGGAFPSDIIRHGQKEASVTLELDGGIISRSWYVNEKGVTVARAITFVRDGKPVPSPVNEIKRMLNPFLLDQDFLTKKNEPDRKRYFSELFAVDTTSIDKEIFNAEQAAKSLRSKLTGYGDIDATPVEPVDVSELEKSLAAIRERNTAAGRRHAANRDSVREHNATFDRGLETKASLESTISELERKLTEAKSKLEATNKWLAKNPKKTFEDAYPVEDTEELERKLREAGAQNVRHEQYKANLKRLDLKKVDEEELASFEKILKQKRAEKIAKLKELNNAIPVKGLQFDTEGNFTYEGTHSDMLSTSQVMRLSSELSSLYPTDLGLELIDRAESLGKSIFTFVKRAEDEKKTILATIVGEKPAGVPENIGVFVVENGKVSQ